jgi:hypothetical protein
MKKLTFIFSLLICFAIARGQHNGSAIYQKLQKSKLPGVKSAILTANSVSSKIGIQRRGEKLI